MPQDFDAQEGAKLPALSDLLEGQILEQLQDKIIRLEENQVFAEQKLEGLHEALLGQQRQLDRLEAALACQQDLVESLRDALNTGGPANVPPPHYNKV